MFLLPSISILTSTRLYHRFFTVTVALSLFNLILGVENVTSALGNVSLIRVFSLRNLSKTSLYVERVTSFVRVRIMMFQLFAKRWMYMIIKIIHSSSAEFSDSNVKIKFAIITQVPGTDILVLRLLSSC